MTEPVNLEFLRRRSDVLAGIRSYFGALGFTEVETPIRIRAPAPELHIDCPLAPVPAGGGESAHIAYLRASPELQMKKLLAAGMDCIYQLGPCFRDGEKGSRHNPEFTLLEWYRRNADYRDIARDMTGLIKHVLGEKTPEPTWLSVRDAYRKFAGWDPWIDWDANRFDFDMATKIEPALPSTPVYLVDYPPAASSLARLSRMHDGMVCAERWELYLCGMELANCFTELCDSVEQRQRFEIARAARREQGEADYPLDETFLAALDAIESAAGVALGVDRLVMLACGAKSISQVRVED